MKYKLFLFNGKPAVVFIENENSVSRYSDDKEEDKFFSEWIKKAKEEKIETGLEDVTTGFSYYTLEHGKYESDKSRVDSVLKDFGYDAP